MQRHQRHQIQGKYTTFAFVQPFFVSSGNNFYHYVAVKDFTTTYLNLALFFEIRKIQKSINSRDLFSKKL